MNGMTVVLGAVLVFVGAWVLTRRLGGHGQDFKRLAGFQQRLGPRGGSVAHYALYVAVPLWLGVSMLVQGTTGRTLTQWLLGRG